MQLYYFLHFQLCILLFLPHRSDDLICSPAMNQIGDIQNPRGNIIVLWGQYRRFVHLSSKHLSYAVDHLYDHAFVGKRYPSLVEFWKQDVK